MCPWCGGVCGYGGGGCGRPRTGQLLGGAGTRDGGAAARGPAAAARRGPGAYVVLGYRLGRREQRGSRRRVTQVTAARPTTAQNLFSVRSAEQGRSCRGPGEVVLPPATAIPTTMMFNNFYIMVVYRDGK